MNQDITSVLLPASRVDFYALDEGTASLAQKLSADWRFARVGIRIEREGMDAAVAYYGQAASPELIIVETNDIGDDFIQKLGALAGVCAAGTDAVIIGPKNDVHLYRSLVEMGVKDYLVRPVSEDDMVKVIARALISKRGLTGSRLVAVIGAKGGVGTTSVAQALAWNIANGLKQKTMLIDAAGSAGSLGIAYGLEPTTTRTEAVRFSASGSEDDMKRICQAATENLSLLVAGGEPLLTESPDPDGIETLASRLMQKFPVVVADLSGAIPLVQKRLLERAAGIVVVTTPTLPALRNTRTLMAELKGIKSHLKDVDLIINMQGVSSEEVSAQDIKAALDMEPAAVIPYAPKVFAVSEAAGKPAGQYKVAEKIFGSLMPVASKASGVAYKPPAEDAKGEGLMASIKKVIGK